MTRQLPQHEADKPVEPPLACESDTVFNVRRSTLVRRGLLGALGASLLAGCTSAMPTYTPQASPLPAYKLGPNDRVRVTVFGEDRLSGEFVVDAEGRVALPLIGEVDARGQSTTELTESIRAKLAGRFILNPRVSVEVAAYRPYFIIGEVNEPGEYPYAAGLTLISAVAQAKGFTVRANKRAALVRRQGLDRTVRVEIGPQTLIAPGDVVTILERWF